MSTNNLEQAVKEIAERVFNERIEEFGTLRPATNSTLLDNESEELRNKLNRIMAKEFISVSEAALLLNCSESYIRKQLKLTKNGKSKSPLPYTDKLGIVLFPREALLNWINDTPTLLTLADKNQVS